MRDEPVSWLSLEGGADDGPEGISGRPVPRPIPRIDPLRAGTEPVEGLGRGFFAGLGVTIVIPFRPGFDAGDSAGFAVDAGFPTGWREEGRLPSVPAALGSDFCPALVSGLGLWAPLGAAFAGAPWGLAAVGFFLAGALAAGLGAAFLAEPLARAASVVAFCLGVFLAKGLPAQIIGSRLVAVLALPGTPADAARGKKLATSTWEVKAFVLFSVWVAGTARGS